MAQVIRLWTAMETRQASGAATQSNVALVVDDLQITFRDRGQTRRQRGKANLYRATNATDALLTPGVPSIRRAEIDTILLNESSIRIVNLGADRWRPQHVIVWCETSDDPQGPVAPLAAETDIDVQLITSPELGNVSLRLRRVAKGTDQTVIRRIMVALLTSDETNSGTTNNINLRIRTAGGREVFPEQPLPSTSQDDLVEGQANLYFLPVASPFTRGELLDGGSIRLRTGGRNLWRPSSFFVFGLNDAIGRPEVLVPLAAVPEWSFGPLSVDPADGGQGSVSLPIE